jgi:hypothetical protein
MLEAIRGRSNVNILCSGSQFISFTDLFRKILNEGAIDLAVLLGSAQHLHPAHSPDAIAIEDAGFLLSQRHASRPDDEVVIWGLLNNLNGEKSALNLWRAQRGIGPQAHHVSGPSFGRSHLMRTHYPIDSNGTWCVISRMMVKGAISQSR